MNGRDGGLLGGKRVERTWGFYVFLFFFVFYGLQRFVQGFSVFFPIGWLISPVVLASLKGVLKGMTFFFCFSIGFWKARPKQLVLSELLFSGKNGWIH